MNHTHALYNVTAHFLVNECNKCSSKHHEVNCHVLIMLYDYGYGTVCSSTPIQFLAFLHHMMEKPLVKLHHRQSHQLPSSVCTCSYWVSVASTEKEDSDEGWRKTTPQKLGSVYGCAFSVKDKSVKLWNAFLRQEITKQCINNLKNYA